MSTLQQKFMQILFEPGEFICSSSNVYGTALTPYDPANPPQAQFIAINPLRDRRLDANVTAYRNILLEFDNLPRDEQIRIISKIPHSTTVWSAGKSFHCIISLATPCVTRTEYDKLVRRIFAKVPEADKSAKNPSRFSRMADAFRDNGKRQIIVEVLERVSMDQLEAWLGPETTAIEDEPIDADIVRELKLIDRFTRVYLMSVDDVPGGRNNRLFQAVCNLTRAGYTKKDILEKVIKVCTLPEHEMMRTIDSAISASKRDK